MQEKDSYGSKFRDEMKRSMEQPASGFRPLNKIYRESRSFLADLAYVIGVFILCVAVIYGCIALLHSARWWFLIRQIH